MRQPAHNRWAIVPLGSLVDFRNGINYSKRNFGTGVKVINVKDFQDYTFARYDGLEEINPLGILREENLLQDGDILFVRSNGNRELIGRSLFVRGIREQVTHSAFTIRTRFKSEIALPRFYAYVFRTSLIRQALSAYGGGTNISNLNQEILSNLQVPLPSLQIQNQITAILSAYDDLIENNKRRIEVLEKKMAQSLYREWFVHFRFPGHENVRMVNSRLGNVPEGWQVKKLSDVVELVRVSINPSKFRDEIFAHLSIPAFDEGAMPALELGATIKSGKYLVPKNGVLLSKINPRIPRVWLPFLDDSTRAIASTEFLPLVPRPPLSRFFVFALCSAPEFFDKFAGRALGTSTSHQRVKPEDFLSLAVNVPSESVAYKFGNFAEPLFSLAHNLRVRNANLRHTRDLLLPKLISGEVDVEGLKLPTEGGNDA